MELNAMQCAVDKKMIIDQFDISNLSSKLKQGSLALFPTDTLPAICSCPVYAKKYGQ